MLFNIRKDRTGKPEPIRTSTLAAEGWKEKHLENYLRKNLKHLIGHDLMIIGQSRPYKREPDLIALDCFGDLWFFELKREATSSDNLLQVMRYSQDAAAYTIEDLGDIYSRLMGEATDSLSVEFCSHFGHVSPTASREWEDKIGKTHHLVVIAEGTDEETVQAVNHWQRHGLDIQLWPFRIHSGDKRRFRLELPDLFLKGRQISRGEPGTFLVNTCKKYHDDSEKYMLEHGCALATCGYAYKINRILSGSRVLLYTNHEGIVGHGLATATQKKIVLDNEDRDPGRIVMLHEFKNLKHQPFSLDSIHKVLGDTYPLLQTVRELPKQKGEKLWAACLAQT
jgi:hypothetical protein